MATDPHHVKVLPNLQDLLKCRGNFTAADTQGIRMSAVLKTTEDDFNDTTTRIDGMHTRSDEDRAAFKAELEAFNAEHEADRATSNAKFDAFKADNDGVVQGIQRELEQIRELSDSSATVQLRVINEYASRKHLAFMKLEGNHSAHRCDVRALAGAPDLVTNIKYSQASRKKITPIPSRINL
jgi:uncharacterized membrane-anchored protein